MPLALSTPPRTSDQPVAPLRLAPGRRRRPGLFAGSALLLATCLAVFVTTYLKAGNQVAVLGVVRTVPQGGIVRSEDLAVVRIAASGPLAPIAASDAGRVVGRHAAVTLVPGALLTRADLSVAGAIPEGGALVGVAVKPSQLPAQGVAGGETVDVVLTGIPGAPAFTSSGTSGSSSSAGSSASAQLGTDALLGTQSLILDTTVLAPQVLVTAAIPGSSTNGDTTLVTLLVPRADAAVVASASAAGQAALVAVPSR